MRVYLSGGMDYATGEGVQWRSELQDWLERHLGHSVFNPNAESEKFFSTHYPSVNFRLLKQKNIEHYTSIIQKLVDIDSKEIADNSDYVICYWDEGAAKGAGTKGELTIARFFNKPAYLVTSFPLHELPGWVLGCVTKSFSGFEELKQFLLSHHGNSKQKL
jgi:hypothetical protein